LTEVSGDLVKVFGWYDNETVSVTVTVGDAVEPAALDHPFPPQRRSSGAGKTARLKSGFVLAAVSQQSTPILI
jgi:hypothetical protein